MIRDGLLSLFRVRPMRDVFMVATVPCLVV